MTITDIKQQQKNKDRCSLYLDGKYALGIHIDTLIKHHLKKGDTIDDLQLEQLKTDDAFRQAYDKALDYLSRRPRSSHEVRQYLRDKLIYKHPDYNQIAAAEKELFIASQQDNVEKIITDLHQKRYLNDVDFAKWWIANRREFKPRGKRLLLLELKTKGLSNEDIHTALTTPEESGHYSSERTEYSETEAARKLVQKRINRVQALPPLEQKQKLIQYLTGKGFEWDVINEVVDDILKSA